MTSDAATYTAQDTINLANRIAIAHGATTLDVLDMPRDAWKSLCGIARSLMLAFFEVGIGLADMADLTDDQLGKLADCAMEYGDEAMFEGAQFAVEAFLEGDLDD